MSDKNMWRINFKLAVVMNVPASPVEARRKKPRISLYLLKTKKIRSKGAYWP